MEKQLAQLVERHTSVEVIGSIPILALFYFYANSKGEKLKWHEYRTV